MPLGRKNTKKITSSGVDSKTNFYLKLSIKDVDVDPGTVISIVIKEWIFDIVPRLELEFVDNGRFVDQFPLEDNDIISIQLKIFEEDDDVVIADFILNDYEILNQSPAKIDNVLIKLSAFLKTNNLFFPIKNRSFAGLSSKEVFQRMSNEIGLAFNSDIVSLKDKMNWIQANQSNFNFMKQVLKRSYTKDDDTQFLYSDRESNLIYTTLYNRIKDKNKVKKAFFDPEFSILNSSSISIFELQQKRRREKEIYGTGSIFYDNWKFKNLAGTYNKLNSYQTNFTHYNLDNFVMDSINIDRPSFTNHSLKESSNVGRVSRYEHLGRINENNSIHTNYSRALIQNDYLMKNFFSSFLMIYSRPDNTIKLFDKIRVHLPTLLQIDADIDDVHSGEYIVGGIIHKASKYSIYNNILVLYRDGLNLEDFGTKFKTRHS